MNSYPSAYVFAVLLLVVALISSPLLASGQGKAGSGAIEIQAIIVHEEPEGLRIEIKSTRALTSPQTFRLSNPTRLVFDFPGTVPALYASRIAVGKQNVVRVRAALFQEGTSAPMTRVVLDLSGPVDFKTENQQGTFMLSLGTESVKTAAATESTSPRTVQARTPVPSPPAPETVPKAPPTATGKLNFIERINVSPEAISLVFREPAAPEVSYLSNPSRMVLDFSNTTYSEDWDEPPRIAVRGAPISMVRHSLLQINPPKLRVVLDQKSSAAPQVASEGNRFVLRFKQTPANPSAGLMTSVPRPPVPASVVVPITAANASAAAPITSSPVPVNPSAGGIPSTAPIVTYEYGLLTINADNSKLTDILIGIAVKTGASIDIPRTEGMQDLVVMKIGPAPPKDVIAALLQGSSYNYFVVEDSNGALQRVVLSPK